MKSRQVLSVVLLELLDLLEDFLFIASRPSMGRMNRYWGYAEMRSAYRAFRRWEQQEYLEKVRQGDQIVYRLGKKGKELLAQRRPSPAMRNRHWDGRWRMVMFDFPETARKGRDAFRHLLRQHRMGCLQKSVWITADSVIPEWKRLLKESKLTEWVLLFESAELGPVDDVDIARKVWSLDRLSGQYQRHVSAFGELPRLLRNARQSSLTGELGQRVRRESQSYFDLLQQDPMLPKVLLASSFAGPKADALHAEVRGALRECLFGSAR